MKRGICLLGLLCLGFIFPPTLGFAKRAKKPGKRTRRQPPARRSQQATGEPSLIRKQKFRTRACWLLYRDIQREDIPRWKQLQARLKLFNCDEEVWRKCRLLPNSESCQGEKAVKRWDSCFRIDRRLHVVTQRLVRRRKQSIKKRCRWRLRIPPQRYHTIRFTPNRKRFRKRR